MSGADGHAPAAGFPLARRGVHQAAEHLDIQTGRSDRGRLPLHAQAKPVGILPFDGLDDAIQGASADRETFRQALDRLPVFAVDDNLAFTVQAGKLAAGFHQDGMAQAGFGTVAMLQRLGHLAAHVLVIVAAKCRIESQHAVVDGQERQAVVLAPVAQAFVGKRIAVLPAGKHQPMQTLEDLVPGQVVVRFEEDGFGAGGFQRPLVTAGPKPNPAYRGFFQAINANAKGGR